MMRPRVLVIAGSDSSGGAGLEADQKTLAAHSCYAMTATTALTAQNTQGVRSIHYAPPDFVGQLIDMVVEDVGVDVVKVGVLASAETVNVVADALIRHDRPISVVDPVMISTSGAHLLSPDAIKHLRTRILPLTTLLTPNIPEAKLLLQDAGVPFCSPSSNPSSSTNADNSEGDEVRTLDDLVSLAQAVSRLSNPQDATHQAAILLKGGHQPLIHPNPSTTALTNGHNPISTSTETLSPSPTNQKFIFNILHLPSTFIPSHSPTPSSQIPNPSPTPQTQTIIFQTRHSSTRNTHGTGCSLASAIAANIALAITPHPSTNTTNPAPSNTKTHPANETLTHSILITAVRASIAYVAGALKGSENWTVGKGPAGPVDHFWAVDASGGNNSSRKSHEAHGDGEQSLGTANDVKMWVWRDGDGDGDGHVIK